MTHLRIIQNNIQENVSSSVIHKLYELAKEIKDYEEDPLNNVTVSLVDLKGNLVVPICYRAEKEYLETKFSPDLHITSSDYAIPFEDPNMVTYLNSIGVGSNGMITETLAAAATVVANSLNKTVTKFNELRYFTNITSSKGGINNGLSGNIKFVNWTSLLEVDISNFVSIGHNSGSAYEDTFFGCTSLNKVTASDQLTALGYVAFANCSSITTITGLSGNLSVYAAAFKGCTNLLSSTFLNVTITPVDGGNRDGAFEGCSSLTSITLDSNATTLPQNIFKDCTALTTINLSNITSIGINAFKGCSSLTSLNLSSCTTLASSTFRGCSSLSNIIGLSNILATMTDVPSYLFSETALTSLSFPVATTIGERACHSMTSLTSVSMPNVVSIGANAFAYCSSLTGDLVINNCTSIGTTAFSSTKLNSLTANSLTSVPGQIFYNGTIKQVTMNSLLTVPSNLFDHANSQLQSLSFNACTTFNLLIGTDVPKRIVLTLPNVETLNTGGVLSYKKLDLGPNLISFNANKVTQSQYCSGVTIIRATSVPTCAGFDIESFSNIRFYVPDASVTAYQTAWSLVSARIFPLSLFATDYPDDIT